MITFRRAKSDDVELIRQIALDTWPSTYNKIVGEAQVAYMLDKMYNKGELLAQLEAGYVFLIAEDSGSPAGFAAFSLTDSDRAIYKLHKLYVLPDAHGKGIGKILMNEVVNQAKRANGKSLELNVNRKNKAKDFYQKCGFKTKETVSIDIGNGFFMDDFVMALNLQA